MKVVAVTGGAQGIGRAISLHFADHGYAVSIADPADDANAEISGLLRKRGAPTLLRATDVSDADAVAAWIDRTVDELGCPDVLVNNAGFMIRKHQSADSQTIQIAPSPSASSAVAQ